MELRTKKITFKNEEGHVLAGRLELPPQTPVAFALFAHCFTCSKDIAAASRISRALAKLGYGVLRFDFTGLGNSDGDFSNTTFSSNIEDLVSAANYLKENWQAPSLLVGHSLGGTAVLYASASIPEVKAVATIGSPADPRHVTKQFCVDLSTIRDEGAATVVLGGRQFKIRKDFLDDLEAYQKEGILRGLQKAFLFMHSPQDKVVGIDEARVLFEQATHPKSFISLDGMDHLLSRRADSQYVADILASWASRYLDKGADVKSHSQEEDTVVVEEWDSSLTQKVYVRGHSFTADEPIDLGGHDKGPSPYELLLAALGACTSMTLRMYANMKKWPLGKTVVRLKHRKIHAEDCQACDTKEGKLDLIEREIQIEGDLDESQRSRLMEIADRCPVHRTLSSEIEIETTTT